jgi:hypothetical protein
MVMVKIIDLKILTDLCFFETAQERRVFIGMSSVWLAVCMPVQMDVGL